MEQKSSLATDNNSLQISESAEAYLKETSGWSQFLSILGFIFIGLLVVGGVGLSLFLSVANDGEELLPMSGMTVVVLYLLLGLIYFFPILYLYRFATNMKKALEKKDNDNLDEAFKNIKSHYKFMGIFTIIFIAIYILGAIGMAIFGSFML
ncbi:MAG: DUF5362 family protein [Bacteroidota bacterium]